MLVLKDIIKNYHAGDTHVQALKGINLEFRENEFVSILGQSGCGKTTLLNIIGGLDHYSSGDLVINGKSTKEYKDKDWDTYRNHSIGFVFQSYNLIPHQTVLANVELALTLSGVSKSERRQRAKEALEKVGLGDQLNKKPSQMSGGQMQRVAIARALVNDPDILLADEPTGALDTNTSIQIMDLLKEISKDKLIIMVTHNPELAEKYSSRIIKLLDGKVIDDSNPYKSASDKAEASKTEEKKREKKGKHTSMSFMTALSLSLNNLMTKKGRTILTAFAGSIGIIGIALILAIQSGATAYIESVEREALSSYPITIEGSTVDFSSMMNVMMGMTVEEKTHEDGKIYSNNVMADLTTTMLSEMVSNDLGAFKAYIESEESGASEHIREVMYKYSTVMNIYKSDTSEGVKQINPTDIFEKMGISSTLTTGSMAGMMMSGTEVWSQLSSNPDTVAEQYDIVAGRLPKNYDEVVLVVNNKHEVTDYVLYGLGLKDTDEITNMVNAVYAGEEIGGFDAPVYTYDEILALTFKLIVNTDYFKEENGVWTDMSGDEEYMKSVVDNALTIKVVGILEPSENAEMAQTNGMVVYTAELMEYLVNAVNDSEIVKQQKANPDVNVFTGMEFTTEEIVVDAEFMAAYMATLPAEQAAQIQAYMEQMAASGMPQEQIYAMFAEGIPMDNGGTYDGNLERMGVASLDEPSSISIYPKDFEAKEALTAMITAYNDKVTAEGKEELAIQYTDTIGLFMSSVSDIINAISYILIAFVAISLVVSSIMIGIITYISVLERTKEIGILRSIGASKKDISRVFNAETLIVGFTAGAIGIGVTLLLSVPINIIIEKLAGVSGIAALPTSGAVVLILISMLLTSVAGLIPAKFAAKKDPVRALRSE